MNHATISTNRSGYTKSYVYEVLRINRYYYQYVLNSNHTDLNWYDLKVMSKYKVTNNEKSLFPYFNLKTFPSPRFSTYITLL